MPVIAKGTLALTKGVPVTLYEALPADLPGILAGKVDLTQLNADADEIEIKLQTKFDTPNPLVNGEENVALKTDNIFRITPTEEYFGWKTTIELTSNSPSASGVVEFNITRQVIA